ncbi:DUF1835 domain-containing protein [uncultured Cohaesibacter sp.]|uniref:DUF1835 domain-containing protein n=1 Tax=uncultured Cohaesibacter sp. TaxID=1002546 RepID=UPI00292DFD2F|nr:DUF1835 domain-containing protein [uncultured Cohaesibacter sp.]
MTTLIITNGDKAAHLLEEANIGDRILPWRDVLHEGPVPDADDGLFATIRAQTLADGNVITTEMVESDFRERLDLIRSHQQFDRIELWFEHDLYDQLQILQCLDMLNRFGRINNVIIVQTQTYLGMQSADTIGRFQDLALPVLDRMFAFASRAWKAYVSEGPEAINQLRSEPIPGFPFLKQALLRLLQELPGPDGLSRTERQIIYTLDRGVSRPGMLFAQVLNMEEAAFLGDWAFFNILSSLQFCNRPVLTGLPQAFKPSIFQDDDQRKEFITSPLHLTEFGKGILATKADFLSENGLHRWWGGTELTTTDHWRWHDVDNSLSRHRAA